MKRYAYRRSVEALCIAALLLSPACSKPTDEALPLSDREISLYLAESEPMTQSRASLFESGADLKDESKGGGYLTLYAHIDGTDKTYINEAKAWYFDDPRVQRWIFLNSNNAPMKYYWPNSDSLNFFAYMPYKGATKLLEQTYVTIGPYSEELGQTFSCDLPAEVSYDPAKDNTPKVQEFIYAYEEELTKEKKSVVLNFKHPFAAINFKVANDSYRMKIVSISFENIYLTGTFSTARWESDKKSASDQNTAWESTGEKKKFTTVINKRIPNDVNYITIFDEDNPFLVMPQKLENVTLRLVAFRDIAETELLEETVVLPDQEWKPGRKYIYTISVGDNKSEIYFNVRVEELGEQDEWTAEGENNIDVE